MYTPKYFTYEEFDSPDIPGSGKQEINQELVKVLDKVREDYGKPMRVNSAYRSNEHNAKVGGVKNSQHRLGNAADIHISNQGDGDRLEKLFIQHAGEECGIGRYNTFIHLDVRGTKARWDKR